MANPSQRRDRRNFSTIPGFDKQLRNFTAGALISLFTLMTLLAFLSPVGYMVTTSLKSRDQLPEPDILPRSPATFELAGEEYPLYEVPTDDGLQEWALVVDRRQESWFADPNNPPANFDPEAPEESLIYWEGRWRQLTPVKELDLHPENFETAWTDIRFPLLLRNTLVIAVLGMIGTIISSISVAYAFARFPIPYANVLFLVLISTIILPRQVTLVPTYAFFSEIGWTGTWLPLIVPHFFANAYNVFLLRQFFRSLPRALDEAAMIDGAGPFRILVSVIIPQSWPAIVAIALFHFVFAWNDYFEPLIYLLGERDLIPISVGIQQLNFIYDQQPHLIQAVALMTLLIPVLLFFFAQRVFMRGIVITGVEK